MRTTGVVGMPLVLATLATACSVGEGGATAPSSSVPASDITPCAEVYVAGELVTEGQFGVACTTPGDELISTRPIRIECDDGRELWWNTIAWGFLAGPMELWPDDAISKVPRQALDECQGAPGTPNPAGSEP